jgi:hypothetical protein
MSDLDTPGSAQDCWSAYIFSTKFKQVMPFYIISWSDSKLYGLSAGGFFAEWCLVGDQQEQNTGYCPSK